MDPEGGAGVSPDGHISGGGILHDGLVERGESVLAPQILHEIHVSFPTHFAWIYLAWWLVDIGLVIQDRRLTTHDLTD